MGSLHQKNIDLSDSQMIFCPIRKGWVAALPEEQVRQRLLQYMTSQKGFPAALMAVEQPLRKLPHLSLVDSRLIPNRRADIVCYAKKDSGALHPLLIVECKSVRLVPGMMNQIAGYNHFVKSNYIMMANQEEMRLGWFDSTKQNYVFVDFLPSYHELLGR